MANIPEQKTKLLTRLHKEGVPLLSPYLEKAGISRNLQQYYHRNGWLERIGQGAYIWPGDMLEWQGVVQSLQTQLGQPIHVGASTALSLGGYAQYLRISDEKVCLFSNRKRSLPKWVSKQSCSQNLALYSTGFIDDETAGILEIHYRTFSLFVSSPERSIIEAVYLVPKWLSFIEAFQLTENLTTLRPHVLQNLLEHCNSVRVKRLFIMFARESGHSWAKRLDSARIDLGEGIRSLSPKGVYIPEYRVVVPRELVDLWR
jgi:hypothetical protein